MDFTGALDRLFDDADMGRYVLQSNPDPHYTLMVRSIIPPRPLSRF